MNIEFKWVDINERRETEERRKGEEGRTNLALACEPGCLPLVRHVNEEDRDATMLPVCPYYIPVAAFVGVSFPFLPSSLLFLVQLEPFVSSNQTPALKTSPCFHL